MEKINEASVRALSEKEAKEIRGGSTLVQYLVKFAAWGTSFFFNMGVQEGRKTRALM